MGDYHDLHLQTDVCLLAGVFYKPVLETLRLDPAHYYIPPGLSWDAVLKKDMSAAGVV